MKFYGASFFCDKGKGPVARVKVSRKDSDYPITFIINSPETHLKPDVVFYMTEVDFVRFKNSVIHQYDEYLKNCREIILPYEFTNDAYCIQKHMKNMAF